MQRQELEFNVPRFVVQQYIDKTKADVRGTTKVEKIEEDRFCRVR